jgi:AcrR family transcriptional regulator
MTERSTALTVRTALPRPGHYARGAETVDQILDAALDVLIDEGASAFTLRRIANRCGIQVGKLTHHFARKELLIQHMLGSLLDYYEALLDESVRQPGLDAQVQLERMIGIVLDDIVSRRTTHVFTELWALSNHNEFVAERVAAFYAHAHRLLAAPIAVLNPALSPDQAEILARYISATMEGTTIFAGHGKPWAHQMPQLKAIAVKGLIDLVRTIRPQDVQPAG